MLRVVLFIIFVFGFTTLVHAHFNVFIQQDEVMKLLGIDTEVFYVKEGTINTYALSFVVKIPANISDLQFSWQSLTKHPVLYALSVNYDNHGAMLPPQINISSTGVIPASVQTFRVNLICTGLKSAEVQVLLQLNVSSHNNPENETSINFRRNKICRKGIMPPLESIILDPEGLASSNGSLYFGIGSGLLVIIILLSVASTICIKTKQRRSSETRYMSAVFDSNQHVFVQLNSALGKTSSVESGSYATIASIGKSPPSPSPYATSDPYRVSYYASFILLSQMALQDPHLYDPTDRLRSLSTSPSTIKLHSLTQEGTFGQIFKGKLGAKQTVLVKTVTEAASKLQISLFLTEGTMMFGLMHKNILPIIAANVDNDKRPLLIYPYVSKGNLKRFLIKCRQRTGEQVPLSTRNLVEIGIQIILGIVHLHSQCLCHKDIATRNCVIDDQLQVKITDSALARDLFPDDYCCIYDNENRPVKWLSIENLQHKQFTSASDVWSFGVVLWELITLAQQPYYEVDFFEMTEHLQTGHRLQQPLNCPDDLYAVMKCCWLSNPMERPTFAQILSYLQDFHKTLDKYI